MPDPFARPRFHTLRGYPVAVIALLLGAFNVMVLETSGPVATIVVVVIASTWFGGTGPGILATAASVPLLVYVLPPDRSWAIASDQVLRVVYFVGISGFIVWILHELRRHNAALARENDERKTQQEMLRRSERELRLVIDTIPTMAWILAPDGRMELINRRWLDYSGMSFDEALAGANTTMHPEDAPKVAQLWNLTMAAKETYEGEMRLRRHDGAYRWFLVRTVPLLDERGEVLRWYGTSTDIEDRKRAEEGLRDSAQQLHQLSRRLLEAHEEERRHFSRELHDEFGQLLVTINLHLHAAQRHASPAAQADLEDAAALLQSAVEKVRGLALELRPAILESGLTMTLRWLAKQHQHRTGLTTEVVGEVDDVPGEVAIACFRVAQQALTNVVQHARARNVSIELSRTEHAVAMVLRDDGRGFDVQRTLRTAPASGHLGLLGMRERVEILGGAMHIDSAPDEGTCIRVAIPLPASEFVTPGAVHGAQSTDPAPPSAQTAVAGCHPKTGPSAPSRLPYSA
ncbi:MAG TPA: PAS domain S-box protein [Usitatibacter sp.]|nr:PAS domain S-box protein [Usitatibacter sp.]